MTLLQQISTLVTANYQILVASALVLIFHPVSMSRLLGIAKRKYYHAPQTLELTLKESGKKIAFADLCKSVIPPCRLNPFLFNGHLQTLWTVLAKYPMPIYYKRWTFDNEDPTYTGQFAVDFVTGPYEGRGQGLPPRTTHYSAEEFERIGSLDGKPMLVILHGLTGGSHELYLRSVLGPLVTKEGGWEACVVNSRGCAGTKITSSVLYNARTTWDVRQVVKWLRETFPNRPLFGCGFSLGANMMMNYVGEEGSACELKAAVILSSPWNLEAGSLALQRTWIGLNVYSKAMGKSLKQLFERHVEQVSKNPKIDVTAVRNLTYLHEFDRLVQGPSWGYPTEGAYYRDAASTDMLFGARIPVLAVHAEDDPVAQAEALPYQEVQQTPYGVLCTTELGGHLSWFEWGGKRWFATATERFLQKMAREVDLTKIPKTSDSLSDGYISRDARQPLIPVFDPIRRRMHVPEKESPPETHST